MSSTIILKAYENAQVGDLTKLTTEKCQITLICNILCKYK